MLVAQRQRPPELAGLWELPGGKVAAGETDAEALVRELREELRVETEVLDRIGGDVAIGGGLTLRAYEVVQTGGACRRTTTARCAGSGPANSTRWPGSRPTGSGWATCPRG